MLEPEGTGILIEQAPAALRRDLHMRPFEAARRVYLMLDAHLLRDESANALLKSLEEPPAYGVFVLVSDHAERMLPTILCARPDGAASAVSRPPSWQSVTGDPVAARAAIGDLGRAERLAGDEDAAARRRSYLRAGPGALTDPGFDPAAAAAEVTAAAGRAGKAAGQALTASQQALLATSRRPQGAAGDREADRGAGQTRRPQGRAGRAPRGPGHGRLVVPGRARCEAGRGGGRWYTRTWLARHRRTPATVPLGQLAQALAIVAEARQSFDFNVSPALAVEALFHRLRRVPVAQP